MLRTARRFGISLVVLSALGMSLGACSSDSHHDDAGRSASSGSHSSSGPGGGTASSVMGKPVSITLASSGDVLPHPAILLRAKTNADNKGFDFSPMFRDVKPLISDADVAICQLETPISADDTNLSFRVAASVPKINSPHEVLDAVKGAGFDGCSIANNHTFDRGLTGLQQTRAQMARVGLRAAGPSATAGGTDQVAYYKVGGVTVAQLSYSFTLSNLVRDQKSAPASAPWLKSNLYADAGAQGIIDAARAARAKGADFVVVSMHWGTEQTRRLSHDQTTFGDALLKSGAVDFIIGNHPHVVQQCAKINGRYVVYSEGNMLSQQGPSVGFGANAQDGVITTVTLKRDSNGNVSEHLSFQPTWVDHSDGFTIKLATPQTNKASYERTVAAMKGDGGCDATAAG